MSYDTPPGTPVQLATYEPPAASEPRDSQTVQTWLRGGVTVFTNAGGDVVSPLILSAGATCMWFTLVAFTTVDPSVTFAVFALPVGWTGPNAGKYWNDPILGPYYLAIGGLAFTIGNMFVYGASFAVTPVARPPGMFALVFSPTDQIPYSLTFDITAIVGRAGN